MDQFPIEVVRQVWHRSGGKCERCGRSLFWDSRGTQGMYGWETHHRIALTSGGASALYNCEILCQDCHKKNPELWRIGRLLFYH